MHASPVLRRLALAVATLAFAAPTLHAQPPASPPSGDRAHQPEGADRKPPTDAEARKRWRDFLQRRLDARRREADLLDRALRAIDAGKSNEQIRQMFPELLRSGTRGEGGGPGREPFSGDPEPFEHAMGGPGQRPGPDDGDVDRLGPGMMPSTTATPSPKPPTTPEPPHALTSEERQAVRDILGATSPRLLGHLLELEKSNAAEADRRYAESLPRLRFLFDLKARDPELYHLRLKDIQHGREAYEAARAIAALDAKPPVDTAARRTHESALRAALTGQYNVRTLIIRHDAESLTERRLALLSDAEKRPTQAAAVVEKNMKSMVDRERRRQERRADKDRKPGAGEHRPAQGERAPTD